MVCDDYLYACVQRTLYNNSCFIVLYTEQKLNYLAISIILNTYLF